MDTTARFFKVFAGSTRQRILGILSKRGEMGVLEIAEALKIGQPNVSHHLQLLQLVGLVISRREGRSILYSFNRKHAKSVVQDLSVRLKIF
jgi:DNA-binding transcriptional ArsR family regulator